ncbi:MAG: deoxyribonuclease V, partial [Alphaproteobacteria bacterium]
CYAHGFAFAAVVVLRLDGLELLESVVVARPVRFPYVPGLLSFREAPVIMEALERTSIKPDLVLVDGHGLAHPRRFGLACHVGVLADVPAIGVAKSRLVGGFGEPGSGRGAWSPLVDRGTVVGAVVRTRRATRPVFVSVGHRVGLETAVRYVGLCAPRYRLPEPIRHADRLSRAVRP